MDVGGPVYQRALRPGQSSRRGSPEPESGGPAGGARRSSRPTSSSESRNAGTAPGHEPGNGGADCRPRQAALAERGCHEGLIVATHRQATLPGPVVSLARCLAPVPRLLEWSGPDGMLLVCATIEATRMNRMSPATSGQGERIAARPTGRRGWTLRVLTLLVGVLLSLGCLEALARILPVHGGTTGGCRSTRRTRSFASRPIGSSCGRGDWNFSIVNRREDQQFRLRERLRL